MSLRTVEEWKAAVYRYHTKGTPLSEPAKVFLLLLTDHMNADRTVKRSRRLIAADLDVAPPTVKGYVDQAIEAGFLSRVQRGQKDRTTAVYQGIFPPAQAARVPRPRKAKTTPTGQPGLTCQQVNPSHRTTGHLGVTCSGGDSGQPVSPPLLRRPTGDATSLTPDWEPPAEPPSPELEETYPEDDRGDPSGTPADHRTTGPAEVLEQGNNNDAGGRVKGSTSRPSAPVAADPTAPQTQGDRGHLAAVPQLDRSRRATDERGQPDSEKGSPAKETFPDDPDELSGTPADHRANADAEVLEQGQQQGDGRRSARPAPRQPEAGRQLDHDATTPVAAVGSATTRGRKATA